MASAISSSVSLLHPHHPQIPSSMEAGTFTPQSSAVEMNRLRLSFLVHRLQTLFACGSRSLDLLQPCISLARSIDFASSNDDIPPIAPSLPSLVKQLYDHRNDTSLQSAILMLMIAIKNVCTNGWFHTGDNEELLRMANELLDSFCMGMSVTAEASNALTTISQIIPRFYPQLKLGELLVSFEAKSGYDVLVSDFHVKKSKAPGESIRLFVVQTDNLETSSCLISPPQVSFLVNGKAVEGRTNVLMDSGPQFPTDITKMLKRGTNIIQAAGYFNGNYIIAVVFMSKVTATGQILKDYVQPPTQILHPDSEIIEGSSRISLNCPLSFKRIKTPVKGHFCKHLQCFDFENFAEMNFRKPAWRCPLCNRPTSFLDLQIDQNMVKILHETTVYITDVAISADGSWKSVGQHDDEYVKQLDCQVRDKSNGIPNTVENVVDLSMNDGMGNNNISEIEETKPLITQRGDTIILGDDNCPRSLPTPSVRIESSVPHVVPDTSRFGMLESLVPTSILNPVIMDVISAAPGQESTAIPVNQKALTLQVAEEMQIQQSLSGNYSTSREAQWGTISRQVSRVPVAIQPILAKSVPATASEWSQPHVPSSYPSSSSSVSYQRIPSLQPQPSISHEWTQQVGGNRLNRQTPLNQSLNVRGQQMLRHCTDTPISSYPPSENSVGIAGWNSQSRHHQDAQRAAQVTSTSHSVRPFGSSSGPSLPIMAHNSQPMGVFEQSQTPVNSPAVSRVQQSPELPVESNWRPTGRMRGSLTGSAYSVALSHYLVRPTLQMPATTVATPTSGQPPISNSKSNNVHMVPSSDSLTRKHSEK